MIKKIGTSSEVWIDNETSSSEDEIEIEMLSLNPNLRKKRKEKEIIIHRQSDLNWQGKLHLLSSKLVKPGLHWLSTPLYNSNLFCDPPLLMKLTKMWYVANANEQLF